MKHHSSIPEPLNHSLLPRALKKRAAAQYLGGSIKLIDRMLFATRHGEHWVDIVSNIEGTPGRDVLIDRESLDAAYERLRNGEEPPLRPSEARYRVSRHTIKSGHTTQKRTSVSSCL
jgi:hypothetical protein